MREKKEELEKKRRGRRGEKRKSPKAFRKLFCPTFLIETGFLLTVGLSILLKESVEKKEMFLQAISLFSIKNFSFP